MRKIKPWIFGTFRCQRPDKIYAFKLPHRLRPPHLSVQALHTNPRLTSHLLQEAASPAEVNSSSNEVRQGWWRYWKTMWPILKPCIFREGQRKSKLYFQKAVFEIRFQPARKSIPIPCGANFIPMLWITRLAVLIMFSYHSTLREVQNTTHLHSPCVKLPVKFCGTGPRTAPSFVFPPQFFTWPFYYTGLYLGKTKSLKHMSASTINVKRNTFRGMEHILNLISQQQPITNGSFLETYQLKIFH